jgi:hypothetical protein
MSGIDRQSATVTRLKLDRRASRQDRIRHGRGLRSARWGVDWPPACGSVLGGQGNPLRGRREPRFAATLTASARRRNWLAVIDGSQCRLAPALTHCSSAPLSNFVAAIVRESHPLGAAVARSPKLASDGGGEGVAAYPLGEPEPPSSSGLSRPFSGSIRAHRALVVAFYSPYSPPVILRAGRRQVAHAATPLHLAASPRCALALPPAPPAPIARCSMSSRFAGQIGEGLAALAVLQFVV